MQCYEYEVLCRWMGARMRSLGANVRDHDISVSGALIEAKITSVVDILHLSDSDIEVLAQRHCSLPATAA